MTCDKDETTLVLIKKTFYGSSRVTFQPFDAVLTDQRPYSFGILYNIICSRAGFFKGDNVFPVCETRHMLVVPANRLGLRKFWKSEEVIILKKTVRIGEWQKYWCIEASFVVGRTLWIFTYSLKIVRCNSFEQKRLLKPKATRWYTLHLALLMGSLKDM